MQAQDIAVHVTQQTVYLMGISFILGSLCTIFILLILDMLRRMRPDWAEEIGSHHNTPEPTAEPDSEHASEHAR